jgi:hypothetical protein
MKMFLILCFLINSLFSFTLKDYFIHLADTLNYNLVYDVKGLDDVFIKDLNSIDYNYLAKKFHLDIFLKNKSIFVTNQNKRVYKIVTSLSVGEFEHIKKFLNNLHISFTYFDNVFYVFCNRSTFLNVIVPLIPAINYNSFNIVEEH